MKILFLNQTFYPDVASTAQHASDLALKLVERGHDVTVVCSQRAYDAPRQRYPRRETWKGIRIRRIASFGFGKKSRWRRAADFGSYLANCVMHLLALSKYDVVVAMTSPPLISWLGALFTRIKGGELAFWVMDLNPDEAIAAGWLRPESQSTRMLQSMLGYSLRRASTVIALDRFMAERVQAKGIDPGKIVVLPPWSHDQAVRYDAGGRTRFRAAHGLDGKYVVMYSGNHSPCHPLATLLQAARQLRDRSDIAFCFVGGGSEFQTVRRFAKVHELENIVTLPYQPLDTLSASLSAADLHTVVMGDPFVGIVHPCKVYNIRTLGIPYLYVGPADSHIGDLTPSFSARHGDVDGVVQQIVTGAAAGCSRIEAAADALASHSQEQVLVGMASALERVAASRRERGGQSTAAAARRPAVETETL